MIQNFGKSHKLPEAAVQPDPNLVYKMVFDITSQAGEPGKVNPGFNHVARAINVFEDAGYPPDKLQLVAVVHSKATELVLKNEQYRQKFSQENPNLDLITQLKQAGVEIYLCGQSLVDHGYERNMIAPEVRLALSALTVLSTYQLRGFALMPA